MYVILAHRTALSYAGFYGGFPMGGKPKFWGVMCKYVRVYKSLPGAKQAVQKLYAYTAANPGKYFEGETVTYEIAPAPAEGERVRSGALPGGAWAV